jgi:hypothetical protein
MNLDQFEALKPILNPYDDNASLDGVMFETYGEELQYVLFTNLVRPKHVWTYCEEDEILFLAQGFHRVNRLGYVITELPYDGEYTTIRIADLSEDDGDGWHTCPKFEPCEE